MPRRRKKKGIWLLFENPIFVIGLFVTIGELVVAGWVYVVTVRVIHILDTFSYPAVTLGLEIPASQFLITETPETQDPGIISSATSTPTELPDVGDRFETLISANAGFYVFEPFYNPTAEEQRIRIYQKGNLVPVQILKVPFYQGDDVLLSGKIILEDINFDTYKDLLILQEVDLFGNKIYRYELFDEDRGVFDCNDVTSACRFVNPHIVKRTDDIIEDKICGENCRTVSTYEYLGGQFVLLKEVTYTYSREYGDCEETVEIDPITEYKKKDLVCDIMPPGEEIGEEEQLPDESTM